MASDFLIPPDVLQARIKTYASQNLRGVLLHIVDPLEENFAVEGRVELQGTEGEKPFLISNAHAIRQSYLERMQAHQEFLKKVSQSAGWFYLRYGTASPLQPTLLRLYDYLKG